MCVVVVRQTKNQIPLFPYKFFSKKGYLPLPLHYKLKINIMKSLNSKKTNGARNTFIYTILFIIFVLSLWVTVYNRNFQLDF